MTKEHNNETVDATEDLMAEVVENAVEEMVIRPVEELINIPYEELSDAERKYLISALKVKNDELDRLTKRIMENNKKVAAEFNKTIDKIESTLEFIQEASKTNAVTIALAVKNIEREVRGDGN